MYCSCVNPEHARLFKWKGKWMAEFVELNRESTQFEFYYRGLAPADTCPLHGSNPDDETPSFL